MTSSRVDLDANKALREMFSIFTSKGMVMLYFWALLVFAIVTGITRSNSMVLYAFTIGVLSILAILCDIFFVGPFFRFLKEWIFQGGEREDCFDKAFERGQYKKTITWSSQSQEITRGELLIFIIFLGIIPALSSSIILSSNLLPRGGNEYTIINDQVLPIDSEYAITSPFTPVVRIDKNQLIVAENLEARTKDGTTIAATINVNLKLDADKKVILFFKNRQMEIKGKLNERLQTAFAHVVGKYTIETLPGDLLLLSHLIHQESLNLLEGIPLIWSGEFSVTKPKIYQK